MMYRTLTLAIASVVLAMTAAFAEPNCGLTGIWRYHAVLGLGSSEQVIDCRLTISTDGSFASNGNCTAWANGAVFHGATGGVLTTDSNCELSGTISSLNYAPGIKDMIIGGGIVEGDHAVAVGYLGPQTAPTEVRMVFFDREAQRNEEVLAFTVAFWGKVSASCPNQDVTWRFKDLCGGKEQCAIPITWSTMGNDHCIGVPEDATIFSYCSKHGKKVKGSDRKEIVTEPNIWDAACPRTSPAKHTGQTAKALGAR